MNMGMAKYKTRLSPNYPSMWNVKWYNMHLSGLHVHSCKVHLLSEWGIDWQHQHNLGTSQKCRISGPTPKNWICIYILARSLCVFLCTFKFEKHWYKGLLEWMLFSSLFYRVGNWDTDKLGLYKYIEEEQKYIHPNAFEYNVKTLNYPYCFRTILH